MTILSVCRDTAPVVGIPQPDAVFGSDSQEAIELAALANEMGERIARAAEWHALKVLHTFTGDGTTTEFALPSDFDRFPKDQEMRSSRIEAAVEHVVDHDVWLNRLVRTFTPVSGSWTLLGGAVHFNPALTDDETVKFYYFSNKWAQTEGGDNQSSFMTDSDVFRLRERTLRLSMIAQWRINKGMDAGIPGAGVLFDFQTPKTRDAEKALAEDIGRDAGPRILRIGRPSMPRDLIIAYPKVIVS